ncbi:MAG: hypothetical protein AAF587_01155 [Bacteroidota bacterium]
MKTLILCICSGFSLLGVGLYAQDLYDLNNSAAFASYLFKSGEYKLAAEEYERVLFLAPDSAAIQLQLIRAYRLGGHSERSKKHLERLFPALERMPGQFGSEYGRVLLIQEDLDAAASFFAVTDSMPLAELRFLQISTELLRTNWSGSDSLLTDLPMQHPAYGAYRALTDKGLGIKRRSPALAVMLSVPVPGLGKIYAGYWKDGLFSLLFTGISAWQAYRGFQNKGTDSIHGWAYTGVAAGFYLGNLYGSAKAARRKNTQNTHNVLHQVRRMLSLYL